MEQHWTCPNCEACISGTEGDTRWHLARQLGGTFTDASEAIICSCGSAMTVEWEAPPITIKTPAEKTAIYGDGPTSLRSSLKHAAYLYNEGIVDDSNGGEVATILATLADNLPLVLEALRGLASSMQAGLDNDGPSGVNVFTYSPLPSFDSTAEGQTYIDRLNATADGLTHHIEGATE